MKVSKLRNMSLEQRAEISSSKRYNKESENELWQRWYDYYLSLLKDKIIPASEMPSNFQGRHDGYGQYVRARPHDKSHFEKIIGLN